MVINQEWKKIKVNKFSPKALKQILDNENPYILDVRPLDYQWNTSFLKGSVPCPLVFFFDRYKELPIDRKIVITDGAMKQSTIAAKFLITKGYKVMGVLKGGVERWETEGFPVEERASTRELGAFTEGKHRKELE